MKPRRTIKLTDFVKRMNEHIAHVADTFDDSSPVRKAQKLEKLMTLSFVTSNFLHACEAYNGFGYRNVDAARVTNFSNCHWQTFNVVFHAPKE